MTSRDEPTTGDALVIVDMQRDFLPGGALAVPGGDEIVPKLNRYTDGFTRESLPIFATRDWHPVNHSSFSEQGGPWPVHCVQDTPGARLTEGFALPPGATIVSKGTASDTEGCSPFEDGEFARLLRARGIRRLWVGGVATEYCVRATVLEAMAQGFEVVLLTDAIRGIQPGDEARAVDEMVDQGALARNLEGIE